MPSAALIRRPSWLHCQCVIDRRRRRKQAHSQHAHRSQHRGSHFLGAECLAPTDGMEPRRIIFRRTMASWYVRCHPEAPSRSLRRAAPNPSPGAPFWALAGLPVRLLR